MANDLLKHAKEFLNYLRSFKYERTGDERGIYFPKARVFASGLYIHDVNGQDERQDPNLLTDEGLMYLLLVGLNNGPKIPSWYLALYSTNYTPQASLTAANFPATAGEIVSNTEGYSEPTRPAWTPSAPGGNAIDNVGNKATFTIATSSSITVNGAALVSESTKGAVTGKLISATKFASPRTLYNTDIFNLAYRVQLTSS